MGLNVMELTASVVLDASGLKTGLNNAKGLFSKFNSGISGGISKLGSFASNAFKGMANAAKNFITSAYQTAAEFEQGMAQVAATLGKTVEELNADIQTVTYTASENGQKVMREFTGNLRDFAMEMGATTKFTSSEVAEAMNYMALAGYDTATTMEMIPNVLSLAAAGGMQLGRASDMITDAGTAFGLRVSESEEDCARVTQMVDEMAKAASTGNTNVTQLGDAFLRVGALAKDIGHGTVTLADGTKKETDNIQELTIALVAMANSGIKSSEAGTHMRNMLMKLSAQGPELKEKLDELGISFYEGGKLKSLKDMFTELQTAMGKMADDEERAGFLKELFNARDMTSAKAILQAIETTDWNKIGSSILDAEGAAARMAETMQNTMMGQLQLLSSAWDNFKISFTQSLNIPGIPIIQQLTGDLQNITSALNTVGWHAALDELWISISSTFRQITDAIPKAIVKLLGTAQKIIVRTMPQLLHSIASILKSLAGSDTGSIGKAISTVSKNLMFVIKNQFKKEAPGMLEAGKAIFNKLVDGLTSAAGVIGDNIVPVILHLADALTSNNTLGKIIDAGGTILTRLIEGITSEESLNAFFDEETGAPKIIDNLVDAIGNTLHKLLEAANKIIKRIGEYLVNPDNKRQLRTTISDMMENLVYHMKDLVGLLWEGVKAIATYIAEFLVEDFDADDCAGEILLKLGKALLHAPGKLIETLLDPSGKGMEIFWGTAGMDEVEMMQRWLDDPNQTGTWSDIRNASTTPDWFSGVDTVREDLLEGNMYLGNTGTRKTYGEYQNDQNTKYGTKDRYGRVHVTEDPAGSIADYISKYGVSGVAVSDPYVSEEPQWKKTAAAKDKAEYYASILRGSYTDEDKMAWALEQGLNLPAGVIPHYASGGIVTEPTLALIGEDGAEAVIPLDGSTKASLKGKSSNVTIQFGNIYVQGGQNTGQEVVKQIDTALRQYQVQQERGTGGTAWMKSIRYQTGGAY